MHDRFGVGCPRRAGLAAAAEGITTEERVEDVAEAEGVAGGCAAPTRPRAVLAEEVVAPTALGILQRLVGDVDLLELLGDLGIGIAVGVVLAGQCPVRALDLVVGGVAGDAEQRVVVAHESTSPSCCEMASTAASAWR
jgi:hypothetical protein